MQQAIPPSVKILIDVSTRLGPERVAKAMDELQTVVLERYGITVVGPEAPRTQEQQTEMLLKAVAKKLNSTPEKIKNDPNKASTISKLCAEIYKDIRAEMQRVLTLTPEESEVILPDPKGVSL